MKQKHIAWLLVLTLSLCMVPALAGNEPAAPAEETLSAENRLPTPIITADALGTVSFGNLDSRMRENNLDILILQENLDMLESIDYAELQEDLRYQLNRIASGQKLMLDIGSMTGIYDTYSYGQMEQLYASLDGQYEAIKDGEMQENDAETAWQLRNLQNQVVMGGEMLYLTIVGLETQEASLQRQLAALNRTVEEMELRYKLGQVSALQLSQTKAGQSALASGLETLRMNIKTLKVQLEALLGAEQTGSLNLAAVPEVTAEQLSAMNVEKDLVAAKANSYELHMAAKTLEDEKETYEDTLEMYVYLYDTPSGIVYKEDELGYKNAQHQWQIAQYTYSSSVQGFEQSFRQLYLQVLDYRQIWEASKVSLESQKLSFAATELKYEQGTISRNAYLNAQDELKAAEEAVETAANDLFSAYNTYCWAVEHGILN